MYVGTTRLRKNIFLLANLGSMKKRIFFLVYTLILQYFFPSYSYCSKSYPLIQFSREKEKSKRKKKIKRERKRKRKKERERERKGEKGR
jgi:hypothetical protein